MSHTWVMRQVGSTSGCTPLKASKSVCQALRYAQEPYVLLTEVYICWIWSDNTKRQLVREEKEVAYATWVAGGSNYAWLNEREIVFTRNSAGFFTCALLDVESGKVFDLGLRSGISACSYLITLSISILHFLQYICWSYSLFCRTLQWSPCLGWWKEVLRGLLKPQRYLWNSCSHGWFGHRFIWTHSAGNKNVHS